ncbi:hypothetical protein [Flavobacterium haoranii]|nr:hypothetical protein [Flavobacterium haoranii]
MISVGISVFSKTFDFDNSSPNFFSDFFDSVSEEYSEAEIILFK